MPPATHGLGRLPAADPRDRAYPIRALLAPARLPPSRYWAFTAQPLDQGPHGTCVGHGWKHLLMSAPGPTYGPGRPPSAVGIYREACKNDPWPDNDDGGLDWGTSVRGGAVVLKNLGLITAYHWAETMQDAIDYLLTSGPLVLGINWYAGMFTPDARGFIRPTGDMAGGHCLVALGASLVEHKIRLLNSWGPAWGQNGRAWINFADFERLAFVEYGEVCAAVEPSARR